MIEDRARQRTLALLGFCLLASAAWATAPGLTPHDIARLRGVGESAIAPDGEAIAYVLSVPRQPGKDEDGPSWAELHVARNGGTTGFITGEVHVGDLGWTPDGKRITFLAERGDDEHSALWAIALDGGEARRLASLPNGVDGYSLCHDGESLALIGTEKDDEDRKEMAEKGFNQKVFEEDLKLSRVWVVRLDGEDTVEPEGDKGDPLPIAGSVSAVTWSPDCERLAVSAAPTPLVDDGLMKTRVHVVSRAGEALAKVDNPGKLGQVEFSPDGEHLALLMGADVHDPSAGRLAVVSSQGGEIRDLLPGLLGHVQDFAWETAGSLTYLVHEGVTSRVATVTLESETDRTSNTDSAPLSVDSVTVDGSEGAGTGGPGAGSHVPIFTAIDRASSTGALALVGSTPAHPPELYRLDGELHRLTDSNPWLAERRLAPQEVVRFKARDGLDLEGILIRPLDEEKGQRYPLIMVVHGGPESHHSDDWMTSYSRPGQTAAARGFAVFFTNYRASTGRGVEFSKLDHGDPAGKEFDDLVDAVDHLVDTGLVDKDRVGITGGSYGGYATAWGATYYSERFAAAVMSVGISEKIAKFGTSDIPNELYLVHDQHWPWDDFQFALERSPAYYVKKARTPILIMHGQKDTRVYPGQSMILYRFLKTIGKTPVRLVLYPNEGHGNRRAAARLDFSLRQLRWMEHYLMANGRDAEPPAWEIDYDLEDDEDDEDDDSAK